MFHECLHSLYFMKSNIYAANITTHVFPIDPNTIEKVNLAQKVSASNFKSFVVVKSTWNRAVLTSAMNFEQQCRFLGEIDVIWKKNPVDNCNSVLKWIVIKNWDDKTRRLFVFPSKLTKQIHNTKAIQIALCTHHKPTAPLKVIKV